MHKERQDEQRLKVGGKREKSLIGSFEPLVPAMPEAAPTTELGSKFFSVIYVFIYFC